MNITPPAHFKWTARLILWSIIAGFALAGTSVVASDSPDRDHIQRSTENAVVLPEPIPDPLEPVNRGLWEVNKGLMIGVIQPTGKGYRFIVRQPVRTGIRNFGRNLGYPRKLVNNLLQGEWVGARDESHRFFVNSIWGLGGILDVGTRMGIPEWDTDFGQTFRHWGWKPRAYLMLPIAGPSNERDALGSFIDAMLNPLSYFPPYSYATYGITYNNLTETVDDYVRVAKADFDPYSVLRYAWTLRRESRGVDLSFEGDQHHASIETLQSVFFTFQDQDFPQRGESEVAPLPNGRSIPFTYWLQKEAAPVVYLIPGLGSHRLSGGVLALAELLYRGGFSVVAISSAYNYEFMERASSVALPGYTPVDSRDLHQALTAVDAYLQAEHPGKISSRALMGYSMGGFHTLYLASAIEPAPSELVRFDRYVSIDAPVRLDYGVQQLDEFYYSVLEWPAAERTQKIEQTFHKVAALARNFQNLTPESVIPLNAIESKFLIGLAFRLHLRDMIFLSQSKTNLGILQQDLKKWRREPVYREIMQYSFQEYLDQFVTRYYAGRGIDLSNPRVLAPAVNLVAHANQLASNPAVRVIANRNDILLAPEHVGWMEQTFGSERLVLFDQGGHLGNLGDTAVQQAILKAVADLLPERR